MISKKSWIYAQSLLEVEGSQNFLSFLLPVSKELTEKKTMKFFVSKTISLEIKKKLLNKILKACPLLLRNFFFILLEGKAFLGLPQIVQAYQELKDRQKGIYKGVLMSFEPFSEEQKKTLELALEKFFNKKIELEQKTDKKLMGGFSIDIGGYSFSNTVLQDLKNFQNL